MAITVNSEQFQSAVKIGLTKVKEAIASLEARKGKLTLSFNGPTVKYEQVIEASSGNLTAVSFDAAVLLRMLPKSKTDLELSQDGPELKIKQGRTVIKLSSVPYTSYGDSNEDVFEDAEVSGKTDTFTGWTKNHPLFNAISLKRSLQAIKDNISSNELVVEAEWGVNSVLKVKLVDQFHGILSIISLAEIPAPKRINIRLPLSSFLLLMDIKGDLFLDNSKIIVKNKQEQLTCRFIAASAFGTIADMVALTGVKPQVQLDGKLLAALIKRVMVLVEPDDTITFTAKDKKLIVTTQTIKGSIREVLGMTGTLNVTFNLPPKNLNDLSACFTSDTSMTDIGKSVVFMSKDKDIATFGAMRKLN